MNEKEREAYNKGLKDAVKIAEKYKNAANSDVSWTASVIAQAIEEVLEE